MTTDDDLYNKARSLTALEPYYSSRVSAMTREALHSKSDIAAELAFLDQRIDTLTRERDLARNQWKLAIAAHAERVTEAKADRDFFGAERIKVVAELDAAQAKLAEWRAAMPRCQHPDGLGLCTEPATLGGVSHLPERCDEHRRSWDTRECDWADLVRSSR